MGAPHGGPSWDPLMGPPHGTPSWGSLHGTPSWDPLMGPPHGTPSWDPLMGTPSCSDAVDALALDLMVEQARRSIRLDRAGLGGTELT